MYLEYFGLNELPFSIAPDPRYLYMSERHREALAHLLYGVGSQGGFVVLTGEVGTGKTTTCRCFLNQIPRNTDVAYIVNPKLSAVGLLEAICDELHIDYAPSPSVKQLNNSINDYLLTAHANSRHTVLIIDEAQNLARQVLEQLRLLTNLETSEKKLLQIILIGQPELRDMLSSPELRQVAQRITAHYHLDNLTRDEMTAYLRCRLAVAGRRLRLFSPAASRLLFKHSKGIPRVINLIADRALLGAYSEQSEIVEASHVRQAAKEMQLKRFAGFKRGLQQKLTGPVFLSAAASIACLVGLGLFLLSQSKPEQPDSLVLDSTLESGQIDRIELLNPTTDAPLEAAPETPGLPEPDAVQVAMVLPAASAGADMDTATKPEQWLRSLEGVHPAGRGKFEAYQTLLDEWNGALELNREELICSAIAAIGLDCLHKQGNWRSLMQINLPAVMTLLDAKGQPFYVTLLKARGEDVHLAVKGARFWTSRAELERYWFGEYTVFWKLPPYQSTLIEPGQIRDRDAWLDQQLNLVLSNSSQTTTEQLGTWTLEQKIKTFQMSRGLEADGIIGTMTLIQLNALTDQTSPTLFKDS